ncbi:MAG TPA: IPTL-CTERM sorting domain-containing protein [Thermoanaerobaculia bacterium]|nr:IPTL-CTERM sorting domain-containing protein [Thermoanaerobaculia bacterium]
MNRRLSFLLVICVSALPSFAEKAIQFDFNDGEGAYSGTNAPAHAAGTIPLSNTSWNMVTAETNAGLVFADGSVATGVAFDVGQSATFTGDINWGDTPFIGTDTNTSGVFNTALARDNFYTASSRQLGVRVRGLTPGTYRVYSIGRGTADDQLDKSYVQTIGIDLDNQTEVTPTIGPAANPPLSWVNGQTHLEGIVTITSSLQWVTVISRLDSPASHPAHALQGLQIVPISVAAPAPAVPALDPAGFALFVALLGIAAIVTLRR